jgi:hypothetical protein
MSNQQSAPSAGTHLRESPPTLLLDGETMVHTAMVHSVGSFRSFAETVISVLQGVAIHSTPTHKGRLPERHFAILKNVALPSGHNVQDTKPVHQIKNFWTEVLPVVTYFKHTLHMY